MKSLRIQLQRQEDGLLALVAPSVGYFRTAVRKGDVLAPGQHFGAFESLAKTHALSVPKGAAGKVVEVPTHGRVACAFGEVLCVLDPEAAGATLEVDESAAAGATGLVFRSPMSGRFYAKPSPDEPAFVSPGDTVTTGKAIGLLEVMKTFNRIAYGGDEVPAQAVIKRVLVEDGADVEAEQPLFELEA